jgi:hypothetical protein
MPPNHTPSNHTLQSLLLDVEEDDDEEDEDEEEEVDESLEAEAGGDEEDEEVAEEGDPEELELSEEASVPDPPSTLRFLSPLFLKSVSYHPPPFSLKPAAETFLRSESRPQAGQVRSGASLIFCIVSNS